MYIKLYAEINNKISSQKINIISNDSPRNIKINLFRILENVIRSYTISEYCIKYTENINNKEDFINHLLGSYTFSRNIREKIIFVGESSYNLFKDPIGHSVKIPFAEISVSAIENIDI